MSTHSGENLTNATNVCVHLLKQLIWRHIWEPTVKKDLIRATLHLLLKAIGRDDPHSFWSTLLFALSVWSLQQILSPLYSPTIIIISHYVYRRQESRNKKWSQSSSFSSWLLSLIDRLPIAAPLVLVLTIIVARHSHPPRQQFVQIVCQFVSSFLNFFFIIYFLFLNCIASYYQLLNLTRT